MISRYTAIALGGMAGASARWAIGTLAEPNGFPWTILMINVAGCALLGALLAAEYRNHVSRLWFQDFGAIGFCGGLTTMSTFAGGVIDLTAQNRMTAAVEYLIASLLTGFAALIFAAAVTRQVRALLKPVEGKP